MHETQENSYALTEEKHSFRLFIAILFSIDIGRLEGIFGEESPSKCCRKSRKAFVLVGNI
jgi:hypothetical protein